MKKDISLLILFCVILPIVLVLLSYRVTLLLYPLTEEQQNVIDFLHEDHELLGTYTIAEAAHLEDVRTVLIGADGVLFFSFFAILIILTHCRAEKELLMRLLKYGGIGTVGIVGVILLGAVFAFEQEFTLFHSIFFPQGNWLFPADSLLIQTIPESFFFNVSTLIFSAVLVSGSIFIVLGVLIERKRRKKK